MLGISADEKLLERFKSFIESYKQLKESQQKEKNRGLIILDLLNYVIL